MRKVSLDPVYLLNLIMLRYVIIRFSDFSDSKCAQLSYQEAEIIYVGFNFLIHTCSKPTCSKCVLTSSSGVSSATPPTKILRIFSFSVIFLGSIFLPLTGREKKREKEGHYGEEESQHIFTSPVN